MLGGLYEVLLPIGVRFRPAPKSPPDIARLAEIGAQHGMQIEAPPGG
jgi:hypothetical protein